MIKPSLAVAALAVALSLPVPSFAQFATRVEAYTSGTGFATEFGTGTPYTDASTALGSPSTITSGDFGGPVTPFAAPYLLSQLVSLGAGGSLTVEFAAPIQNSSLNPFGLDFLVFGSASFLDADWPNGVTDGTASMFGQATGTTRVFAGNDPGNMFLLNPSLAPVVDGRFPTDGAGNFQLPADPALGNAAFANKTLAQVRGLYGNSGGGTGFDLAWAVDGNNQPVGLSSARFIRVDVLTGHSEIDAFASVLPVPEPGALVLTALGSLGIVCLRRQRRG